MLNFPNLNSAVNRAIPEIATIIGTRVRFFLLQIFANDMDMRMSTSRVLKTCS